MPYVTSYLVYDDNYTVDSSFCNGHNDSTFLDSTDSVGRTRLTYTNFIVTTPHKVGPRIVVVSRTGPGHPGRRLVCGLTAVKHQARTQARQ